MYKVLNRVLNKKIKGSPRNLSLCESSMDFDNCKVEGILATQSNLYKKRSGVSSCTNTADVSSSLQDPNDKKAYAMDCSQNLAVNEKENCKIPQVLNEFDVFLSNNRENFAIDTSIFDCQVKGSSLAEQWRVKIAQNPTNKRSYFEDVFGQLFFDPSWPLNYRTPLQSMYNYIVENDFPVPEINLNRAKHFTSSMKNKDGCDNIMRRLDSSEIRKMLKLYPKFKSGKLNPMEKKQITQNLRLFFYKDIGYASPIECKKILEMMRAMPKNARQCRLKLFFASFIAGPKMMEYRLAYDVYLQIIKLVEEKNNPTSSDVTSKNKLSCRYTAENDCTVMEYFLEGYVKKRRLFQMI